MNNSNLLKLAIVLLLFLCGTALGIAFYIVYVSANRDSNAIYWNMITAIATVSLALIAYKQLKGINDTSRADFFHKYNKNFFTDRARELFLLFDYDLLELHNVEVNGEDFYYFKKKLNEINQSPLSAFFKHRNCLNFC